MFSKFLAILLAVVWPVDGQQLSPGDYNFSLDFDGRVRDFLVHVPTSLPSDGAPLFFNFHGFGNAAQPFSENTGMKMIGEREGFIGIVPSGWQNSWNGGSCCGTAARLNLDDVGLTRAMVNYVAERVNINRSRVFAAGIALSSFLPFSLFFFLPSCVSFLLYLLPTFPAIVPSFIFYVSFLPITSFLCSYSFLPSYLPLFSFCPSY